MCVTSCGCECFQKLKHDPTIKIFLIRNIVQNDQGTVYFLLSLFYKHNNLFNSLAIFVRTGDDPLKLFGVQRMKNIYISN